MKKVWLVILALVLSLSLVGLIFKGSLFGQKAYGALQVMTQPASVVFLDGKEAGKTTFFNYKIEAGEHLVRIVPQAGEDGFASWEGKVTISPNILTAISRTLATTEAASAGEILTLEKDIDREKSSITVVSVPDKAVVKLDGQPKGFAPVIVDSLAPGNYQVNVAAPGYEERTIEVNTFAGYKLLINIKLSQKLDSQEASPSATTEVSVTPTPSSQPTSGKSPSPTPTGKTTSIPAKPYVVIKETPTGWLKVRAGASSTSEELSRVNPGEKYHYLDKGGNTGDVWYQIEYQTGKKGWVSGLYVDLIE